MYIYLYFQGPKNNFQKQIFFNHTWVGGGGQYMFNIEPRTFNKKIISHQKYSFLKKFPGPILHRNSVIYMFSHD